MHPFFLDKVQVKEGPLSTPCWIWIKGKCKGYGSCYFEGKILKSHRLSKELHTGETFGPEIHMHHECETPACCNPEHLTPLHAIQHAKISTRGAGFANRIKEFCEFGHPLSGENNMGPTPCEPDRRRCRKCHKRRCDIEFESRKRQMLLDYFTYKMPIFENLPRVRRGMSDTLKAKAESILNPSFCDLSAKKKGKLPTYVARQKLA